jgi:chemotaxis signal transduction protein
MPTPPETDRTLVFRIGAERFGLPLPRVLEVLRPSAAPLPVPGAPGWLRGIINHHGQVVPVIHLSEILAVAAPEKGEPHILIELERSPVALEVQAIESIEELHLEGPAIGGRRRAWVRGTLVSVLDPDSLAVQLRGARDQDDSLTGAGDRSK